MMNRGMIGLTPPTVGKWGAGTAEPAAASTLTLTSGVALWGSSTVAGNSDATGVTPATVLDGLTDGGTIYNGGAGGETHSHILTRIQAASGTIKDYHSYIAYGGNGLNSLSDVAAAMTAYADAITAIGHSRFLLGNTQWGRNAEAPGSNFAYLNEVLYRRAAAAYPGKVLNQREPTYAYPAADADDLTDKAAGLLPRSSLIADKSHLNQYGQVNWTTRDLEPWVRGQEGDIAYVPWQHIIAEAPASPAANDVLGTLAVLDGGGTGTTYEIPGGHADITIDADTGELKRIGATPLNKDYYDVPIRALKNNTYDKVGTVRVTERQRPLTAPSLVRFDGNVWLTSQTPNLGNTKKVTVVFSLLAAADGTSMYVLGGVGVVPMSIEKQTSNGIRIIARNAASTTILSHSSGTNRFRVADGEVWAAFSCDLGAGLSHFYTNDTVSASAASTLTDDTIRQSGLTTTIGANSTSGTSRMNGSLRRLWIANDYIDFSIAANRRLFFTAAGAAAEALPSDGSVLTDDARTITPIYWQEGNAGDWFSGSHKGADTVEWVPWQVDTGSGMGRFTTT